MEKETIQENNTEQNNPNNNGSKLDNTIAESKIRRDAKGRVIKGTILNPYGRPAGKRNFETEFWEAVSILADENKRSSAKQVYLEILAKGVAEARKGKFLFYKDIMDRLHGQAKHNMDITSGGEKLNNTSTFIIKDFTDNVDLSDDVIGS